MTISTDTFLSNLKTADLFEGRRYDNDQLVAWNHAQTHCAICGHECKPENSHTVKKGRGGAAASQVYALPLCHDCHVEYETTNIEIYLANHPQLFEIVTRHIEKWADYFTGEQKAPPRAKKVPQKAKETSIFKKSKRRDVKGGKCYGCGIFINAGDGDEAHLPTCKTLIKDK